MGYQLYLGDCLEVMKQFEDHSIDLILADLPYGTSNCDWDEIISLPCLWTAYKRIKKKKCAIVLFSAQPFTSILIMSNLELFKYDWVWNKNLVTSPGSSAYQPMRSHESICIFYDKSPIYNKQYTSRFSQASFERAKYPVKAGISNNKSSHYGKFKELGAIQYNPEQVNPRTSLEFDCVPFNKKLHPTEKPVTLLEYLIKTYSNEGDTVLDNVMGSGSTGEACLRTKRRFVGIEKDPGYFEIAKSRLENLVELPEGKIVKAKDKEKDISLDLW